MPLVEDSLHVLAPLGPAVLLSAARAASERRSADSAVMLALAAAHGGAALDEALLTYLVPRCADPRLIFALLRGHTGDRFALLVHLLNAQTLPPAHELLCIRIAGELAPAGEPPPELARAVRRFARRWDARYGESAVVDAVTATGDAVACELVGATPLAFDHPTRRRWRAEVAAALKCSVADLVATSEGAASLGTQPVRRELPKVGRNEPCPCGSGQKFKKCCEGKPVRLQVAFAEDLQSARRDRILALSSRELWQRPVGELLAAPLELLDAGQRMVLLRRFAALRWWPEALAVAAVRRPLETDVDWDELNQELLDSLLAAGERELSERVVGVIKAPLQPSCRFELDLLRGALDDAAVVAHVEEVVRSEDVNGLIELAVVLLLRRPLLGLVVARAAMRTERPLDNETLVEVIADARGELMMAGEDPAAQWLQVQEDLEDLGFDLELDDEAGDLEGEPFAMPPPLRKAGWARGAGAGAGSNAAPRPGAAGRETADAARKAADAREADALNRALAAATARAQELDAKVERMQAELAERPGARGSANEWEGRTRVLRRSVEALQVDLRERNDERASLRRRVGELEGRLQRSANGDAGPTPQAVSSEHAPELRDDGPAPHPIVVPVFEARAAESLRALPAPVARGALRVVAELAAGRGPAWREAKPLEGADGLWSARVGIHYRVLFRRDAESLFVLELVSREGHDAALRHLR